MSAISSYPPITEQKQREDSSIAQPRFILHYDVIRKYAQESNAMIQSLAQIGLKDKYCGPYAVLISLRLLGEKPDHNVFSKSLAGKVDKINKSGSFVPELVSMISSLTKRKVFTNKLTCAQINQSLASRKPVIIMLPHSPENHFSTIVGSDLNNYYLLNYSDILSINYSVIRKNNVNCIYFEG